MAKKVILLIVVAFVSGCYLPHHVRLEDDDMITRRSLVERPFEEIGLVHAEKWAPAIFWKISLASLRKTVRHALVREARKRGADAIVDVEVRVENHYSLAIPIAILCWEECHATGTAIRYTDKKRKTHTSR